MIFDAISRQFGPLIALHMCTSSLLLNEYRACQPVPYSSYLSSLKKAAACHPNDITNSIPIHNLTAKRLVSGVSTLPNKMIEGRNPYFLSISCVPISMYSCNHIKQL